MCDWADEIIAFANSIGGMLIVGAGNDGSDIGMSRTQIANLDKLLKEISSDKIKLLGRI